MENAVTVKNEITEAKITEYLDAQGITKTLNENEKRMFINIAREYGLNPFKREIHITAYGSGDYRQCSIITGYEVYIKRAERTGKLDGWSVKVEGTGDDMKAVITIHRKDMSHPFTHEVYYPECVQTTKEGKPNKVWSKMPRFMLKKVAIGQAFRLCFSDDLGGMPYEEAEIVNGEFRDVTEPYNNEKNIEKTESKPVQNNDQEIAALNKEIGKILKTVNPNKEPYFTDKEIDDQRKIFNEANGNLFVIREQHKFLVKALEGREKKYYDSIPFEDNIPETNNNKKVPIF